MAASTGASTAVAPAGVRFEGISVCAFDAYGTLFDVNAAARNCAEEPGREVLRELWPQLGALWRDRQLQYTWLRTIMGEHVDFWRVTQDGLDYALASLDLAGDADLRERLLDLYRTLDAYPEAADALRALRAAGLKTAILSNGAPRMLDDAVKRAGLDGLLDAVLSVEDVGAFKPDRRVYEQVTARFGVSAGAVAFFSSNGWDVAGASWHGFQTAWVNRAAQPVETLPWKPKAILADLSAAPSLVAP